jgi:competence ComEA-like helix-hairpin-helix protein
MAVGNRKLPWLNPGDRLVLAVVFAGLIGLLGLHGVLRSGLAAGRPKLRTAVPAPHKVNLNTAASWELQALLGIGQSLAAEIIGHRQRRGPFRTVEDLVEVHGIGPKTLERLRPYVTVAPRENQE